MIILNSVNIKFKLRAPSPMTSISFSLNLARDETLIAAPQAR